MKTTSSAAPQQPSSSTPSERRSHETPWSFYVMMGLLGVSLLYFLAMLLVG